MQRRIRSRRLRVSILWPAPWSATLRDRARWGPVLPAVARSARPLASRPLVVAILPRPRSVARPPAAASARRLRPSPRSVVRPPVASVVLPRPILPRPPASAVRPPDTVRPPAAPTRAASVVARPRVALVVRLLVALLPAALVARPPAARVVLLPVASVVPLPAVLPPVVSALLPVSRPPRLRLASVLLPAVPWSRAVLRSRPAARRLRATPPPSR